MIAAHSNIPHAHRLISPHLRVSGPYLIFSFFIGIFSILVASSRKVGALVIVTKHPVQIFSRTACRPQMTDQMHAVLRLFMQNRSTAS